MEKQYDNLRRLGGRKPKPSIERFEASYIPEPNTGCWLWIGTLRGSNSYGVIKSHGKNTPAHRYAYEAFKGKIPEGLIVCHHCDMPSCVNPNHLFIGTQADNEADKVRKGRQSRGERHRAALSHLDRKGENSPRAKLNWELVKEIRKDVRPQRIIANAYNVSQTVISNIKLGKTWSKANG